MKPETVVTQVGDVTSPDVSERRGLERIEVIGLGLLGIGLLTLLISPGILANGFDILIDSVQPVVVDVFLTGPVGIAVIISVILGRTFERLGFTDAMMRVFVPMMRFLKINPAVIIPSVYNIFGDINAAGRISGSILRQAGATRDEQKIAVATMVQSQQSFSTFMLGVVALTFSGVNVFAVVVIAVFMPLILSPWILSLTIFRNVKNKDLLKMPRFTPTDDFSTVLFKAAKEGVELLLLVLIPAVALVYFFIGILDYTGIWQPFSGWLEASLLSINIEPATGLLSILVSPTLAMGELQSMAQNIDPSLVVGSFVLASSGLPLSAVFGQIPVVWAENSDLTEKETIAAVLVGIFMRFVTAFLMAVYLTPFII